VSEPYDLEAERCVLGALMLRPEGYTEIQDRLSPEDFFRYEHGLVYRAMGVLHQRRVPIDLMTVKDVLEREGSLEQVKLAYLSQLPDGVPRSTNILHYSNVVIDYASKRRLRQVCRDVIEQTEGNASSEDVATELVEHARSCIRLRGCSGESLATALQVMVSSLDDEVERFGSGITGLEKLDVAFRPGELMLLAGRPSHGKTALALHMAKSVAEQGLSVFFASLEMTKDALSMRWLSSHSGVSFASLRSGNLSKTDYKKVSKSLEHLSSLPITVDDHAAIDLTDLRRALIGKKSLLIVDYLQLVKPPIHRAQNRSQEVGAISRGLKAIAHDLKIPVLALCQLNRQVEQIGGEPSTSHLRDSGELEQDSDVIVFVSRPHLFNDSELPDRCVLKVAKHRNGGIGKVELVFNGSTQTFRERTAKDPQPTKETPDSKRMKKW
jgi:replicative DNA helicase